jgi:hypothetical protein
VQPTRLLLMQGPDHDVLAQPWPSLPGWFELTVQWLLCAAATHAETDPRYLAQLLLLAQPPDYVVLDSRLPAARFWLVRTAAGVLCCAAACPLARAIAVDPCSLVRTTLFTPVRTTAVGPCPLVHTTAVHGSGAKLRCARADTGP